MRAPLSIVIPTLDAADDLPETLHCLFEGLEIGLICELIISDGGSTDDTIAIAQRAGALTCSGAASRGRQLARGAEIGQGRWLLFLHADTHLQPGWAEIVLRHIKDQHGAACFRLRFRDPSIPARIVAAWANFRSRWFGLPYGDQALLISAATYRATGGFKDIPLMEDVAMARAVPRRIRLLPAFALTSAKKYQAKGWVRQGARNWWTLARYLSGTSPEILARNYRRR